MNVYKIIAHNRLLIEKINADEYPNLHRLMEKTTVITKLIGIMECFTERYAYPVYPPVNPKYFIISKEKIYQWCKTNRNLATSTKSWQAAKVLLEDMGLVQIIHVRGKTEDPILDSVFTKAQEKDFATCTIWGFPKYDKDLLHAADEVAGIYFKSQVNLSKLTKSDVRRVRGTEIADKLYHGYASNTNPIEEEVYAEFHRILRENIEQHGYMVANTLLSLLYIIFEEKNATDFRYYMAINKAYVQRASLAAQNGYSLHCPRKEDRAHFGIASSFRKWIITR